MISGSYKDASASGSGASGLPTLSYTTSSGADRLLIFTISFERDHAPTNGSNWANPATTGGASPVVTIGGVAMSRLRTSRYFHYSVTNTVTDAVMSVEMIVYGLLESSIPSGTNTFTITGLNAPLNAGDEAIYTAMMFENVAALNYLASSSCESCNAISLSTVNANDGNNMILGLTTAASDRTLTQGAGFSLVGSKKVVNATGVYSAYAERDGMATGAQFIKGTISGQTVPFAMSGAADVSSSVEVGFRLVSNVLLPVELIEFSAVNDSKNNNVFWETASEIHNDYFEIQRSDNGVLWDSIGVVDGNGTSFESSKYNYVDENVDCTTCYYRLKQVNLDGTFEYSNVVVVKRSLTIAFALYPNPAVETVNVSSDDEIESLSVINSLGSIVSENLEVYSVTSKVDVQEYPAGTYFVRIKTKTGYSTKQFLRSK